LIWAICALADRLELDSDALLRAAGIPLSLRSDPEARASLDRKMALVRVLLQRTGDPSVGIDVGALYDPLAFHVVAVVSALLPTARDATRLFTENAHLLDATFAISVDETPDEARIVFTDNETELAGLRRFYMDVHLAVVVSFWRGIRGGGTGDIFKRVDLDYAEPADTQKYQTSSGARCASAPT
jgi:hypothetical protein